MFNLPITPHMTIPYTGMRLVPAFFAIAAAATAGSAGRVPPELAVIGEPSTVLKVTYSVASSKFSFKPSSFLNSTGMQEKPPDFLDSLPIQTN